MESSFRILDIDCVGVKIGSDLIKSSDGQVGPGLSVLFRVQFMPDSLADDESSLEVRHQAGKLTIPIRAIRLV